MLVLVVADTSSCCCSGSSGFVELAVDMHTGEHVAVKFIARGEGFSHSSIQRELFNQRMCAGHPHIVQILVRAGDICVPQLSLRAMPAFACSGAIRMCCWAKCPQRSPNFLRLPPGRTCSCCQSTSQSSWSTATAAIWLSTWRGTWPSGWESGSCILLCRAAVTPHPRSSPHGISGTAHCSLALDSAI